MSQPTVLEIARIAIAVSADPSLRWEWSGPIARFIVPSRPADVEISCEIGVPPASPGQLLFDSGAVWRMLRDGDQYRIECRSDVLGERPYKVGLFDETFTRGRILVREDIVPLGLSPLDFPLDEVLIANLLGRGRGVELHSCGVIDADGRGHLFVGVSGAGKTTTARLWQSDAKAIVSDDRVIVREEKGAMWMYGTPWHGEAELASSAGAPLAGVYLLEQALSNEIRPLSPVAAVARLLRCAFPPFFDPTSIQFTLAFLERLAATVSVSELRFLRDRSIVSLVREAA